jgi:hypothetical protein
MRIALEKEINGTVSNRCQSWERKELRVSEPLGVEFSQAVDLTTHEGLRCLIYPGKRDEE